MEKTTPDTDTPASVTPAAATEQTYFVAIAKADGGFEILREFTATDNAAANEFAHYNFNGLEWFVLDSKKQNVNAW
jgi:hypothetical protein